TGRAVETVDHGLAVLVVPEADRRELTRPKPGAGGGGHARDRVDGRAGGLDRLALVLAVVGGRLVFAVPAGSRRPEVGARSGRQVAARVGAGGGVVAAVAADRDDVGVDRHVAGVVEREGDGAGREVAAGEDGRVGQLLAAADDHRAAGHRVNG